MRLTAVTAALTTLLGSVAPLPAGAADTIIAARTIPAGAVVAKEDLRVLEADGGQGGGIERMIGLQSRRAIYAGTAVRAEDLGPATLVERNEIVTMRYASGRLGIRTEGRALEPGSLGERIRVINLGSRMSITAVVAGEGLVEVSR